MKLLQARFAENYKYETVYTRDAKINTQTITHTHSHMLSGTCVIVWLRGGGSNWSVG